MRTVILQSDLFEFKRHSCLKHLEVVGPKCSRLFYREDLPVCFARDGLTIDMEGPLELAVDMQIAALRLFQKHQVRAVIKNGSESCFAFAELLLGPSALSDIPEH